MDSIAAELTATAEGWKTWRFTCDLCDRATLWTALDREPVAADMARTNGWIVEDSAVCPACATVARKLEPRPRGDSQAIGDRMSGSLE